MQEITAFQVITLAIAAIGAVLGIINTWRSVDRSRVKLRVIPAHAIPFGSADPNILFCIQITNLSEFAVTIDDAGVLYHHSKKRGSIVNPVFLDHGTWPRHLEPRTAITVYSQLPYSTTGKSIKCAYARTQCGYIKIGTSPALKQIAEQDNDH